MTSDPIAPILDPEDLTHLGLTKVQWMTGMIMHGLVSRYGTGLQLEQVDWAIAMAVNTMVKLAEAEVPQ